MNRRDEFELWFRDFRDAVLEDPATVAAREILEVTLSRVRGFMSVGYGDPAEEIETIHWQLSAIDSFRNRCSTMELNSGYFSTKLSNEGQTGIGHMIAEYRQLAPHFEQLERSLYAVAEHRRSRGYALTPTAAVRSLRADYDQLKQLVSSTTEAKLKLQLHCQSFIFVPRDYDAWLAGDLGSLSLELLSLRNQYFLEPSPEAVTAYLTFVEAMASNPLYSKGVQKENRSWPKRLESMERYALEFEVASMVNYIHDPSRKAVVVYDER